MQIRDAGPDDAQPMCLVLRRSIIELCEADHRNDPVKLGAWLANKTPETVAAWMKRSDASYLVAMEDGVIAAVGAVTDDGEILLNYVAPSARFRGASRALLAALEARVVARGGTSTRLTSTETARRFYRARGYEEIGAATGKFGMESGYPMEKAIALRRGEPAHRATAIPPAPAVAGGGRLTIDLGALAENWRSLAKRAAPAECAAVVKANAYGTGIERAGPALWAAGARSFFVAQFAEGVLARRALPEAAVITVLNGLEPDADPADYAAHRLEPAIGSAPELERWTAFAVARGQVFPCALHLDTGMRRLGFGSLAELEAAVSRYGEGGADLLMTHLVSAEAPDDPVNARQIALFEAARSAFPHLRASLANSSGLFLPARRASDLERPGYALYGGNPTPGAGNPMRTVVTLTIPVQQTRRIEPGATCGYNAQWTAKRPTRLATLLAGYADGLPPAAGATDKRPGADVVIAGKRCPLVGRVSMDLVIADVSDLPEDAVQPGVRAEFFGDAVPLDDFAARSGVIGYQLLTGLGARYRRDYIGETPR